MERVSVTLTLEYDRDLTGDAHWGTFATIFAAQAKMKLVGVEVTLPVKVDIKISQEQAPGSGAFTKGDTYT